MAKDTFYFQHDYEPTSDPKMQAMVGEFGALGYGLYWRMVEMMHSDETHKLPKEKYLFMAIAKQMGTDVQHVSTFVEQCSDVFKLFISDDHNFWSNRVFRNIEKRNTISERGRRAGKASAEKRKKQTNESTQVQQVSTGVQHPSTKERKGKEKKGKVNENETIDIREKNFITDIAKFKGNYPDSMLKIFYLYWSEKNVKKTIMRFEMQKTWDLSKRLVRWQSNNKEEISNSTNSVSKEATDN